MSKHCSPSDLELLAIDGLDAVRAADVEAHVVGCDLCSVALSKEAALELAFEQIARAPARVRRPIGDPHRRPLPRSARCDVPLRGQHHNKAARLGFAVVTGTLSLAAAWMLFLTPGEHRGQRTRVSPTSGMPFERTAAASDATAAAFDGRSPDPLDGG
jgi:hypothetical protein